MCRLILSSNSRLRMRTTDGSSFAAFLASDPSRCSACLDPTTATCISASGDTFALSSIDATSNATYRILPCPHSSESPLDSPPLLLTHRVYAEPFPLPFPVHLATSQNPRQTSTLETGYKTWDGSVYLLRYILSNQPSPSPFIELGCGTGFAGIFLSSLWNVHATLTDLPYLSATVRRNASLNPSSSASFQPLDWSQPPPPSISNLEAPTVLASDVIYLRELIQPFCATIIALLKAKPPRTALIAHQVRGGGGELEAEVERTLRGGGLMVERIDWRDEGYEEPRLFIWRVVCE
mmetsp:Transcript_28113/g.56127  ORF Transcript_28113/g.56127 Transcript_28113/m.56127 type:complete len:293 (+) Transcript_28113:173-1051(+)